jgi:hypothetical protein
VGKNSGTSRAHANKLRLKLKGMKEHTIIKRGRNCSILQVDNISRARQPHDVSSFPCGPMLLAENESWENIGSEQAKKMFC